MIRNEKLVEMAAIEYREKMADESRKNWWLLANNVLYELCKAYPKHENDDEIVTKMWLIGRSYAAAIERRKNASKDDGDFYYEKVAPKIRSCGRVLDEKIREINLMSKESWSRPEHVQKIVDAHKYLITIFRELTELDKRSLASKYLHFHCPDAVYIYDSIASTVLRKMVCTSEKISDYEAVAYDSEYLDFCLRAIELREYLNRSFNLTLSVRELDTLLLNSVSLI